MAKFRPNWKMDQSCSDMFASNPGNNPWTLDIQDIWNPTKEQLEPDFFKSFPKEFTSIQDFVESVPNSEPQEEFTSIQDFVDSSDMESLPNGQGSPVKPDKSGIEGQEVYKALNGHLQQPCEEVSVPDFIEFSDMESLPNRPSVSPVDPDKSNFEGQEVGKLLNDHLKQPCEVGSTQYCLQDFMDDFHFEGQEVEAAIQNIPSPKEFLSPELTRISQNEPIYLVSDEFQLLEGQEVGACLPNIPYAKDFLAPKSPVDPDLDEIHVRFEGREVEHTRTKRFFVAGIDAKFAMKSESLMIPQMCPEHGK